MLKINEKSVVEILKKFPLPENKKLQKITGIAYPMPCGCGFSGDDEEYDALGNAIVSILKKAFGDDVYVTTLPELANNADATLELWIEIKGKERHVNSKYYVENFVNYEESEDEEEINEIFENFYDWWSNIDGKIYDVIEEEEEEEKEED